MKKGDIFAEERIGSRLVDRKHHFQQGKKEYFQLEGVQLKGDWHLEIVQVVAAAEDKLDCLVQLVVDLSFLDLVYLQGIIGYLDLAGQDSAES